MLRMSVRRLSVLVAAAVLSSAVAGGAMAADKNKRIDFTVRSEPTAAAPGASQMLKWDARKGRWGLTLDMQQSEARETTGNDVQAGAYYRITPSLRVGGAVALGEEEVTPRRGAEPDDSQPRVRLETRFKF